MSDATKDKKRRDDACLECPLALICTSSGKEKVVVEIQHCHRCKCDEVRVTVDTGTLVSCAPNVEIPKGCSRLKEHQELFKTDSCGPQPLCSVCQNRPPTAEEKKLIESIVNKTFPGDDKWPKP